MSLRFPLCFLTIVALATGRSGAAPAAALTGERLGLQQSIDTLFHDVQARPGGPVLWSAVQALYEARGLRAAFVDGNGERPAARVVRAAVDAAVREGLPAARYGIGGVDDLPPAEQEARFAYALLALASDRARGASEPERSRGWAQERPVVDVVAAVQAALDEGAVGELLRTLGPTHPQYRALGEARARCERAAADGGWPTLPATSAALPPGRRSPLAARLRARLEAEGVMTPEQAPADLATPALGEALRRFQQRHGLAPGRLDAATVAALNVPAEERVRQIDLNLERWRWLPRDLGARHVLVNVAAFELLAVDGEQTWRTRVASGQPQTPTPIFSDSMQSVVFSPWWNVPANIAREELLPALRREPGSARRRGMVVARGPDGSVAVRQRPGAGNALGRVKFVLPNRFDIFLHDTPATAVFARARRSASHGCVRVEQPAALASWLLRGQPEWTSERIRTAMLAGREQSVSLRDPVPVHLAYLTAWVDEDGSVRFLPDVYGHDRDQGPRLEAALGAPPVN